jgi:rare lipoprotein A
MVKAPMALTNPHRIGLTHGVGREGSAMRKWGHEIRTRSRFMTCNRRFAQLRPGRTARRAASHAAALAAGLLATGLGWSSTPAEAKTPGRTYCFNGVCHTVKTIEETRRLVGKKTLTVASFYDDAKRDRFNPSNLTSSGEYFRASVPDNAASPVYPNGTKLVVWHPQTKKAVMVRINNAGPYYGNRMLDLSRAAAEKIGLSTAGVKQLHVVVVAAPSAEEATYRRGRTYAPVKGFLGQHASLELAVASAGGALPGAPVVASTRIASALAAGTSPATPGVSHHPMPVPSTRVASVGGLRRPN